MAAISYVWILIALAGRYTMASNNISTVDFAASNETREQADYLEMSVEKQLIQKLMATYDRIGKVGRPVTNASDCVTVFFGLGLIQMEVREKENMLSISAWAKYNWKDVYLTWNPDDYDDVRSIKVPHDMIWTPDILLYNTATTDELSRDALAEVVHDGTVKWYPHRLFQSSCFFDVTYFPFDNQTCTLIFGSWTHKIKELDLRSIFPHGVDLSIIPADYKDSSMWEITAVEVERFVPDGYQAVLTLTVHLQRKLMFSSYILTVPAVFLSFLTLIVFALPAHDVEKCQLGLTIFGNLLLLLLILLEAAPPTASAVPLLGIFYCFTTVIVILSVFLSTFVVKLGNPDGHGRRRPVPDCLRKMMASGFGRLCFMSPLRAPYKHPMYSSARHAESATDSAQLYMPPGHAASTCQDESQSDRRSRFHSYEKRVPADFNENRGSSGGRSGGGEEIEELRAHIKVIRDAVEAIHCRQKEKEEAADADVSMQEEWTSLASLLDRLFFVIYFVAIILSLVLLFPKNW